MLGLAGLTRPRVSENRSSRRRERPGWASGENIAFRQTVERIGELATAIRGDHVDRPHQEARDIAAERSIIIADASLSSVSMWQPAQ